MANDKDKKVIVTTSEEYTGPEADKSLPEITSDPDRSELQGTPLPKDTFTKKQKAEKPEIAPGGGNVPKSKSTGFNLPSLPDAPKIPVANSSRWILILGGSLLLANLLVGGQLKSAANKLWNKPEGQGPQANTGVNGWEIAGEGFFILILKVLADVFPPMTQPILLFIIALWLVWIVFVLPSAYKKGLSGIFGPLLPGNTDPNAPAKEQLPQTGIKSAKPGANLIGPLPGGTCPFGYERVIVSNGKIMCQKTGTGGGYFDYSNNGHMTHHEQFIG